jgi:hypothetical protein
LACSLTLTLGKFRWNLAAAVLLSRRGNYESQTVRTACRDRPIEHAASCDIRRIRTSNSTRSNELAPLFDCLSLLASFRATICLFSLPVFLASPSVFPVGVLLLLKIACDHSRASFKVIAYLYFTNQRTRPALTECQFISNLDDDDAGTTRGARIVPILALRASGSDESLFGQSRLSSKSPLLQPQLETFFVTIRLTSLRAKEPPAAIFIARRAITRCASNPSQGPLRHRQPKVEHLFSFLRRDHVILAARKRPKLCVVGWSYLDEPAQFVRVPGARNARCRNLARRSSCNLCSYAFLHDFEQNRSIHFRCTIKPS